MPISNPVDEPTLLGKYYETFVNRIRDEVVWDQGSNPDFGAAYPGFKVVDQVGSDAFKSGARPSDLNQLIATNEAVQNHPDTEFSLDLGGYIINAYVVYNLILDDAIRFNRIRRTRVRRVISGNRGYVAYDQTEVAFLSEDYALPFDVSQVISQQEFAPGQLIQDEDYELLFAQLYGIYTQIRDNLVTFESTVCHASCHSSCHGSRGRR